MEDSKFDLLEYWSKYPSAGSGKYRKFLPILAFSKLGWLASAAGVERIFSIGGVVCRFESLNKYFTGRGDMCVVLFFCVFFSSALRNRYTVILLEMLIFCKKNKRFMPTIEDVVKEYLSIRSSKEKKRKVASEEDEDMSSDEHQHGFFEVSSKNNVNNDMSDNNIKFNVHPNDKNKTFDDEEIASLISAMSSEGVEDDDDDDSFESFMKELTNRESLRFLWE